MNFVRIKLFILISVSIFLASCVSINTDGTKAVETFTVTSPIVKSVVFPTFTIPIIDTFTPSLCDPLSVDYCIGDGNFYLHLPIASPGVFTIDRSYPYGTTSGGTRSPHSGVEFYNASGTPVQAALEGIVVFSGEDTSTVFGPFSNYYGTLVVLQHELPGMTLYTFYGHLSKGDVELGDQVISGQKIGEVGASGVALGSHLHFEVRRDPFDLTSTLNPELWLIPLDGRGVLSIRFTDELRNFLQVQPNIQYYPDRSDSYTQAWQPEPYASEISERDHLENLVLGNLESGQYRITYIWEGILYEKWVEVHAGMLTQVAIVLP